MKKDNMKNARLVLKELEELGNRHAIKDAGKIEKKDALRVVNGYRQFIPSIGPIKGKVLAKLIKEYRPVNVLEIGVLFGYSSILMRLNMQEEGRVTAIEKSKGNAEIAKFNIERAGFSDSIKLINGDALEIIPRLNESFDFVFIDAAKDEYLKYLKGIERSIRKGGVVVSDNVGIFENYMPDFLDYVRSSGKYKSETIKAPLEFSEGIEDAIEVSIKI